MENVEEIKKELDITIRLKEQYYQEQQFEKAARYRMKENQLKTQLEKLINSSKLID